MNDELFNKLISFIIKQSAVDDKDITRDTQIEDDLGVTGDDAVDFMIAYGKEFNVDITKFMAADYFGPEGSKVLTGLLDVITKKSRQRKTLTVGHLEKAAMAGQLDEEITNS